MKKIIVSLVLLSAIPLCSINPILQKAAALSESNLDEDEAKFNEFSNALIEAENHKDSFNSDDKILHQQLTSKLFNVIEQKLQKSDHTPLTINRPQSEDFNITALKRKEQENQKKDVAIQNEIKKRQEFQRFSENVREYINENKDIPDTEKSDAIRRNLYDSINMSDSDLEDLNNQFEGETQNFEQLHHNPTLKEDDEFDEQDDKQEMDHEFNNQHQLFIEERNKMASKKEGFDFVENPDDWDIVER